MARSWSSALGWGERRAVVLLVECHASRTLVLAGNTCRFGTQSRDGGLMHVTPSSLDGLLSKRNEMSQCRGQSSD
jgi:hypothetical protein